MSVYLKNRKSKMMLHLFEEPIIEDEPQTKNIKEQSFQNGGSYQKNEIEKIENKPLEKLRVPKFSKKKTDVHKNNIVLILN